jgi:ribosomal protein S6--L-glutamate ligase
MIIHNSRELKDRYDELKAGDVFLGILSYKFLKDRLLIDLLERGVRLFPSALAQTLSSSKVAQALVLRQWMLPHTLAITRRLSLMHAISYFKRHQIKRVVTKEDRLDCGYGIHYWEDIEEVYNQTALQSLMYPFVVQPFIDNYTDIRVVIAGDYIEAYTRENPYNFRNNISAGGTSRPYHITSSQLALCREVMERGKFPYAHIDILVTPEGKNYLSEIALDGGLKGARIDRDTLCSLKEALLQRLAGDA